MTDVDAPMNSTHYYDVRRHVLELVQLTACARRRDYQEYIKSQSSFGSSPAAEVFPLCTPFVYLHVCPSD